MVMKKSRKKLFTIGALVAAMLTGFAANAATDKDNGSVRGEIIIPLIQEVTVDPKKAELGKKLWFDPRLSKSGFISCNSCHNLSMGGRITYPHQLVINGKKDQLTRPLS